MKVGVCFQMLIYLTTKFKSWVIKWKHNLKKSVFSLQPRALEHLEKAPSNPFGDWSKFLCLWRRGKGRPDLPKGDSQALAPGANPNLCLAPSCHRWQWAAGAQPLAVVVRVPLGISRIIPHPSGEGRKAKGGVGDFVTFSYQNTHYFPLQDCSRYFYFCPRNKKSSFSNWCRIEKNRKLWHATTFLQSKWSRSNPLCFIWKKPLAYPNMRVN